MKITQVIARASKRYPWTHRIEFDDAADQYPVYKWTEQLGIPGVWAGGNFYTVGKYVTIVALTWSEL